MNQEEYAFYLRGALNCDTAKAAQIQRDSMPGPPSIWAQIGGWALLIILLVGVALVTPASPGGDPSSGN